MLTLIHLCGFQVCPQRHNLVNDPARLAVGIGSCSEVEAETLELPLLVHDLMSPHCYFLYTQLSDFEFHLRNMISLQRLVAKE